MEKKKKTVYPFLPGPNLWQPPIWAWFCLFGASFVAQLVKNPPAMWETWGQSLDREDPLEKEMVTHSSCTEESHAQRNLACYSPWGRKESDMTEAT